MGGTLTPNPAAVLIDKILQRKARVGVIGLGYVGLPLAVAFAQAGFKVTGLDADVQKVQALKKGQNYIADLEDGLVAQLVEQGLLSASRHFSSLEKLDVILICVPTPLRQTKDPDMSYIVQVVEKLKTRIRPGQAIVLESTTYPGTTREVLLPHLEMSGLKAGKDFFLAYSPERIDPANQIFTLENTPKVVGGITERCTQIAALVYQSIVEKVVPVRNTHTAEMVKLLENTFRVVNIGLVNEIALICDKLGIDTWEVIQAASTKPFGFMPFYPGPGLGGHCIPVDPHYLAWKLKTLDYTTRFIELASQVNQEMPEYVVQKIQDALNERRKPLKDAKILLLGVAYKKNVSDTRESPAYAVADLLAKSGADLSYSDPFVPKWQPNGTPYRSKTLTPELLKTMDCVVLLTDHDDFDVKKLVRHAPLFVDTRNAAGGLSQKKIVRL